MRFFLKDNEGQALDSSLIMEILSQKPMMFYVINVTSHTFLEIIFKYYTFCEVGYEDGNLRSFDKNS